jgi:hypothetical protein
LHSYTQSLRFQLRDTAIQVIEIIPLHVQTGLQGDRGYDPKAMPLDAFIAETMTLLQTRPQAHEVVVRRAQPLRFAERDGTYEPRAHRPKKRSASAGDPTPFFTPARRPPEGLAADPQHGPGDRRRHRDRPRIGQLYAAINPACSPDQPPPARTTRRTQTEGR